MTRELVLDTETTGLEPSAGHRVIEIAALELVDRRPTGREFWTYLNPDRPVDPGAYAVHGIGDEALRGQPRFADRAAELLAFLEGGVLVIHNAEFDLAFLDAEFARAGLGLDPLAARHEVVDTLRLARRLHPGVSNSLDALCRRYGVDLSARRYHGARLDVELLAQVYLRMTAGQVDLGFDEGFRPRADAPAAPLRRPLTPLVVRTADPGERRAHIERLRAMAERTGSLAAFWREELDGALGES